MLHRFNLNNNYRKKTHENQRTYSDFESFHLSGQIKKPQLTSDLKTRHVIISKCENPCFSLYPDSDPDHSQNLMGSKLD